ncbi:hypothetical protein ACFL4Z_02465 [candidate division KSB1 bacterium]
MQTNAVSQNFNFSTKLTNINKNKNLNKNSSLADSNSYNLTLSANYKETAVSYSTDKNESKNEVKQIDTETKTKNITEIRMDIRNEIKMQTIQLLTQYLEEVPEVKSSLKEFFTNNPESLNEIAAGKIPEYFNVENTAKRILDIYFSVYDGEEKEAFVERARRVISQAYSEVEQMVGTLPDIVLQTRDKVFEILDKFANGEDVSDFVAI